MNQELFSYIAACPTAFQAVAHTAQLLEGEGYRPLRETEEWTLEPGGRYYVQRNGSSLIAFRLPHGRPAGFMMTAAHGDSPSFKIKENAELPGESDTRLSVEGYGGMLCASWMDRPLSIAGRAMVRTERGVAMRLVNLREPTALIPNVAIHMNRDANNGMKYNFAVDMQPLYGGEKGGFRRRIAETAGVAEDALLTHDLFLYNPQPGVAWGDYISAPRLDDLQCAFASLQGFLTAEESRSACVYCLFDNEEVGSETKQGAASTFLAETLERICDGLGLTLRTMAASSFLLSCDNAHGVHPNHPEYADIGKIKDFLSVVTSKDKVMTLLSGDNRDIKINVKIGADGYDEIPKECSLVTATYSANGNKLGTYGVIGPIRMDYQKVVAVLENVGKILESILTNR